MKKILPVVMCGGSGTRIWPESRETYPKQFISLLGAKSTFQMAIEAVTGEGFEPPLIISNYDYRFLVAEQLKRIGVQGRIVLEPVARDSGPAIGVAAQIASQADPRACILVLAADHFIEKRARFV